MTGQPHGESRTRDKQAEPHHFQEIRFKAVKKHFQDNSHNVCRVTGADVNLTVRETGGPRQKEWLDVAACVCVRVGGVFPCFIS